MGRIMWRALLACVMVLLGWSGWIIVQMSDQIAVPASFLFLTWASVSVLTATCGLLLIHHLRDRIWRRARQDRDQVTAHKQQEIQLREREERLAFVVEGSRLGIWDWNIETGEVAS